MDDARDSSQPHLREDTRAERDERARRRAEALRANLKKRKQQQRARRAPRRDGDAGSAR